ncbi:hypothetical protein BDN72DRAFT_773273, partial [Pluteus cervinus]
MTLAITLSSPLDALSGLVVARRRKIDEEMMSLQESIRRLRMERNALSPIYCLSPEVLAQIFVDVRDEFELAYVDIERRRGWTVVAQISQYWREVALESSTLWSTISVGFPGAEEWLTRTKGRHISIYTLLPTPSSN